VALAAQDESGAMTATLVERRAHARIVRPLERGRAQISMTAFIATEAALFICLFLSYWYLSRGQLAWPPPPLPPPRLGLSSLMTVLLLSSSATLHWGTSGIRAGNQGRLRTGLTVTALLGLAFLITQVFEYREYLKHVAPKGSAYGSIFYTITGIHGAHVLLGALMIVYIGSQARMALYTAERHLPVRLVSWYWHFVDVVWVFIFGILYVRPYL
jgi:heme/copper-type cytochrome/quinol oxidase subunit 3